VQVHFPLDSPLGLCTLTSSGTGADGHNLVLSTTVDIVAKTVVVPPTRTGEPWASWLYWLLAAIAAIIGFGLVTLGRRRTARAARTAQVG
jgi:hypothetical protein